jgi:hypothetical protein
MWQLGPGEKERNGEYLTGTSRMKAAVFSNLTSDIT